jgi:hypothetical protein
MVRSQCGASRFYLMLHAASYAQRRMQLATVRMRFDTDNKFCRTLFYSVALQIISWIATRSHALLARNHYHHYRFDVT